MKPVEVVPGELIGEGVTSHVHAGAPGTVVKLFKPGFESLAGPELTRSGAVHAAGAPCAAVHGMVEANGRPGLVFDRLDGPPLLGQRGSAAVLADVHVALHQLTSRELPQLADSLADLGIVGMPHGDAVFHGDFHPANVLWDAGRWNVIDWSATHLAPAAADVACSVVTIGYRNHRVAHASVDVHRRRTRFVERYLDASRDLRPDALADLPAWTDAIGRLLLQQQPDLAFADELAARWLHA